MRFDILTLFPDVVREVAASSILGRAQRAGSIEVHAHDIRAVATDTHRTVDDTPYGGGPGMLLRVDVLVAALEKLKATLERDHAGARRRTIALSPSKQVFSQAVAAHYATHFDQITLVCGHYEGFDARFFRYVDETLSVGTFVLTGGELPALTVVDAVSRLVPGVLGHGASAQEESYAFTDDATLLEYPQYTRPAEFRGEGVPDVLMSGNHAAIATWRRDNRQ